MGTKLLGWFLIAGNLIQGKNNSTADAYSPKGEFHF